MNVVKYGPWPLSQCCFRHFRCLLVIVLALDLLSCGGKATPPPHNLPCNVIPVWVMPGRVEIAQESSETVAIGLNRSVGVVGSQCTGFFTSPATIQVSGLPAGVTVSPASLVVTPQGGPQPLTFSVDASATPATTTLTLTGTSSTMTASTTLPFSTITTSPLSTPKCQALTPAAPNPNPTPNEWIWTNGSNVTDAEGTYGTEGVAASGNTPSARDGAVTWTDAAGALWLFGGYGPASTFTWGDLNDLWKYSNGEWNWIGGSNQTEQTGVYGTRGAPSVGNIPGARWESASWTGSSGNFWLFGGLGLDSNGKRGDLNDLWEYSPATNAWAWMAGPSSICNNASGFGCSGVYGNQGIAAAENAPGSRVGASSWTDSCGNLWLFGGSGNDSSGGIGGGNLNDLWRYDPTTNLWTWMSGANINDQNGTYGTLGIVAPGNVPGSRLGAVTWTDKQGNLWLFGGIGGDLNGIVCIQSGQYCVLNDLWEYNPATAMWAWMGGSNIANQAGSYGIQGVASSTNMPGARTLAVSWTDGQGNFWLFGGSAMPFDANDLWEYSNGQWTWVSGSNQPAQPGTYGTMGVAAPGNVPGARKWAAGWIDQAGDLWLFGGDNIFEGGGKFNDLWEYYP